jgi:hypothetical protein
MKFQNRVWLWMHECFGGKVAADRIERHHRFLEEALELVQALGCSKSEAQQLVDYVYSRPVGEPVQELGGVMVTLAALSEACDMDMQDAGLLELVRISDASTMSKIRAKQAAKPKHSPLPAEFSREIFDVSSHDGPAFIAGPVVTPDAAAGSTRVEYDDGEHPSQTR